MYFYYTYMGAHIHLVTGGNTSCSATGYLNATVIVSGTLSYFRQRDRRYLRQSCPRLPIYPSTHHDTPVARPERNQLPSVLFLGGKHIVNHQHAFTREDYPLPAMVHHKLRRRCRVVSKRPLWGWGLYALGYLIYGIRHFSGSDSRNVRYESTGPHSLVSALSACYSATTLVTAIRELPKVLAIMARAVWLSVVVFLS